MGRGGRRPGAGRKPHGLKRLVIRACDLARLSQDEIRLLNGISRKLAAPVSNASPNGPQNQIESNTAIEKAGAVESTIETV